MSFTLGSSITMFDAENIIEMNWPRFYYGVGIEKDWLKTLLCNQRLLVI